MLRVPQKLQPILQKRPKKYCVCHTKRPSTRCQRHLNVTKCHACHAKRSKTTCETSKSDPSCRTYHRHGTAFTRTVADGCGRLRTVGQLRATTPSTPRPPEWNGNHCYAFRNQKHAFIKSPSKKPWDYWAQENCFTFVLHTVGLVVLNFVCFFFA